MSPTHDAYKKAVRLFSLITHHSLKNKLGTVTLLSWSCIMYNMFFLFQGLIESKHRTAMCQLGTKSSDWIRWDLDLIILHARLRLKGIVCFKSYVHSDIKWFGLKYSSHSSILIQTLSACDMLVIIFTALGFRLNINLGSDSHQLCIFEVKFASPLYFWRKICIN